MTYNINLELFGVHIHIACEYVECAQGIKKHFSQFLSTAWRSPDIIIECKLRTAERKLFRAIDLDNALDDLKIFLPSGELTSWDFPSPFLPPYYLTPFKDRFIGLHAAAVNISGKGAIVIAANRGHGKTSSAIHLVNSFDNCQLLADETAHIVKRSTMVEPFPTALSVYKAEFISKQIVAAEETCKTIAKKPASINQFIFLEKSSIEISPAIVSLNQNECLPFLLKHHVDVGCNKDEAMHTLCHLAKNIPAVKFSYFHHQDLLEAVATWRDI